MATEVKENPKFEKLAGELEGWSILEIVNHLVDEEVDRERGRYLVGRLSRRNLAEQIAARSSVDPGDVEHVLANLELTPTERLSRSLSRGRLRRHRR